ncbi:hypothetical protein [Streptomyces sp. IBSBF 2806]|uniref:hypothetical protein n=1 Tax=Streptomyces sp. IBSBF 2806 TaxID=2903529 RepID=UPI002FDC1F5A
MPGSVPPVSLPVAGALGSGCVSVGSSEGLLPVSASVGSPVADWDGDEDGEYDGEYDGE